MPRTLVDKVRSLIADEDPKQGDYFDKNFTVRGDDEVSQRGLNRFFRERLNNAPTSTLDERECLRDDIHPDSWVKYFESHVLPTLIRFKLLAE